MTTVTKLIRATGHENNQLVVMTPRYGEGLPVGRIRVISCHGPDCQTIGSTLRT